MRIQIALAWSDKCEKEMIEMGFTKREVYVKSPPFGLTTQEQISAGDSEFYMMENPPDQFVTTSWWGAGPE
ncbi:MAG: hypothetical protein SVO01_12860 [Thermotogota bacterium]|nr:hypothetical protein [Thermotogota bacterium]